MTEDQATRIALKLLYHKDKPLSKTREKKIIQEVCEVGTKLGMKFSQENPRDSICWTGEVAISIYRSYIRHSDSVDRILQSLYKMGLITETGKLRMRLRMT